MIYAASISYQLKKFKFLFDEKKKWKFDDLQNSHDRADAKYLIPKTAYHQMCFYMAHL